MRVPSDPPPPFPAKIRCAKSIWVDLFLCYTSLFQHPPSLSAKVRCVKSIRVDLFLLLRAGEFGNTHGIPPFTEWGGGGGRGNIEVWLFHSFIDSPSVTGFASMSSFIPNGQVPGSDVVFVRFFDHHFAFFLDLLP